jgi:hypothetical protein
VIPGPPEDACAAARKRAVYCTIVQTPNPQMTDEQLEAQAKADFTWLLDDPRGRRIARTLLRWTGVDDTGPMEGIEAMAAAAGGRRVGNLLKATMRKHDVEGWVRLEGEHARELVLQAERAERAEKERAAADLLKGGPRDARSPL